MSSKLWGGRFSEQTDAMVHKFNASLSFDKRLYREDIAASIVWAEGLVTAGVLDAEEAETIVGALNRIRIEMESGSFAFSVQDEDIHSAVERRLTELVGPVGGKLHTGRSRNDQVATDHRLWVMRACDRLEESLQTLQGELVASAEAHLLVPMPGYTHLQPAQPITWGHWILSHFWPLVRDRQRLAQARTGASSLPLGSAALAGSAFPINRIQLADSLGFAAVSANSLDAVSDRDYAADFLYATTLIALHLSRLSEQLILFSSREFGFVVIDDAYSTGSSIMPQKKNPDTLELTRGKSGRLLGNLTGFLTTLKALPSTYDKDLQEDKEPLFDAFDTLQLSLLVMSGLISTLRLQPEQMKSHLDPALLATDLADYLVRRGVPFRQAHQLVGRCVLLAEKRGVALSALQLTDLRTISSHFGEDVGSVFDFTASLASRAVVGGTAPAALHEQLDHARRVLSKIDI